MALAQAIFEEYWPCWQRHFSPEVRLRLGGVPLSALADCTPGMAGRYLSTAELERWTGLSLKKRSAEWLGGRLAAKWAVARLLGEPEMDWRTLVIHNEEDGRPYVTIDAGAVLPCISISHSGPMAAALAANLPCGLDIQETGDRIQRVKECFAFPEEMDILSGSLPRSFSEIERLTILWAAKEAVRKMVRIAPLLGLLEIRLLAGQDGCGTPQEPLALSLASGREQDGCPAIISVLCFFANNLAWAIACPPAQKE